MLIFQVVVGNIDKFGKNYNYSNELCNRVIEDILSFDIYVIKDRKLYKI